MMARPRLNAANLLPISKKPVYLLQPPEEVTLQRAMCARLPHADMVPLMVAARAASDRYRAWSQRWDDPVV